MSNFGKVVQVIGPVVDVEFGEDHLPAIYNAVRIADDGTGTGIKIDVTCEVEQHLGQNRVRCVSMEPTDGMVRGMKAIDTGAPITVPVGRQTLGRVINVLGRLTSAAPLEPVDTALQLGEAPRADTGRYDSLRTEQATTQEAGHDA